MELAPVVLFVYNRLEHTKKVIETLSKNKLAEKTELHIYSDGAKNPEMLERVQKVREYIENLHVAHLFKDVYITKSNKNLGLSNSIITGVTDVINRYGKVIVLEDDEIVSNDFLVYMNEAMDFYENDDRVASVSAFTPPIKGLENYTKDVYMTRKGECSTWGTWKKYWEKVDWEVSDYNQFKIDTARRKIFDSIQKDISILLDKQMNGEVNSWAVRWCYYLFQEGLYTIYPAQNRVYNIGYDGTGTHCTVTDKYSWELSDNLRLCKFETLQLNKSLEKQVAVFFYCNFFEKVKRKLEAMF